LTDRRLNGAILAARVIVGLIFLLAAIDKIQAPGAFADSVRAFHILPSNLVLPFAFLVPWLELLVAVYLLAGFMSRLAAAGSILLLLSFIIALTDSLLTGNINHACGCFGAAAGNPIVNFLESGDRVTLWDVIRDSLLLLLSVLILLRGAGRPSIDDWLARRRVGVPAGSRRSQSV